MVLEVNKCCVKRNWVNNLKIIKKLECGVNNTVLMEKYELKKIDKINSLARVFDENCKNKDSSKL